MALAAGACSTRAFAQASAHAGACVAQRGDGAEEQTAEERDSDGEGEDGPVDADVLNARQALRSNGDEQTQRAKGERKPGSASHHAEHDAFEQKVANDAPTAGAKRGADGKLLMAAFSADKKKIGDIRAGDQEHDADRSHQDPEQLADVSNDILTEGTNLGANAGLVKQLYAEAWRRRKAGPHGRDHARDVGVGGFKGNSGLEPSDAIVAELAEGSFAAIELERQKELGLFAVEKTEAAGHDADDLMRLAVEGDSTADDGAIGAETALPIAVAEHDSIGRVGGNVGAVEPAAQHGRDAEDGKHAVRDVERLNLLRAGLSGDGDRIALIDSDVL